MISRAKGRFLKLTPNKVRQVLDLIRGKDASEGLAILSNLNKRPAVLVKKILNSAISNAKQKGIESEHLYVSKAVADNGPIWKRFRAASFGRASKILKRTSHISVELDMKLK
ncbi:MAG: 50S ribosomal protein L22 [Candidatus Omnitrophota bacterium]